MTKTRTEVINILAELSQKDGIVLTDSLQGDLSLDSLDMVTLLVELEDTLKIELDESDMNPFDLINVADVIALAERYVDNEDEQ